MFHSTVTILNSHLENVGKSQTSLCLTNNIFLFGQEEINSVSITPVSTVTVYKSLIFFSMVDIFQIFFTKKNPFKITNQILSFLVFFLCFNSSPTRRSKSNDLKCCSILNF